MINPSLPTLIFDKYSSGLFTIIFLGGVSTVTSNVIESNSLCFQGGNLGSFVAAEIAASSNALNNNLSGNGYPIQPLNPKVLFKVTNMPDLKEKLFLNSFSSLSFVPFFRYSVTIILAVFTRI